MFQPQQIVQGTLLLIVRKRGEKEEKELGLVCNECFFFELVGAAIAASRISREREGERGSDGREGRAGVVEAIHILIILGLQN